MAENNSHRFQVHPLQPATCQHQNELGQLSRIGQGALPSLDVLADWLVDDWHYPSIVRSWVGNDIETLEACEMTLSYYDKIDYSWHSPTSWPIVGLLLSSLVTAAKLWQQPVLILNHAKYGRSWITEIRLRMVLGQPTVQHHSHGTIITICMLLPSTVSRQKERIGSLNQTNAAKVGNQSWCRDIPMKQPAMKGPMNKLRKEVKTYCLRTSYIYLRKLQNDHLK